MTLLGSSWVYGLIPSTWAVHAHTTGRDENCVVPLSSARVPLSGQHIACLPFFPSLHLQSSPGAHSAMTQVNQTKKDAGSPHSEAHSALSCFPHMKSVLSRLALCTLFVLLLLSQFLKLA